MNCKVCGNKLSENENICELCGARQDDSVADEYKPINNQYDNSGGCLQRDINISNGMIIFLIAIILVLAVSFGLYYIKSERKINTVVSIDTDKNNENEKIASEPKRSIAEDEIKHNRRTEKPKYEIENTYDESKYMNDEDEYMFPSDIRYISEYDLNMKTRDEVFLIRNEIYARHGYIFKNEPYASYFGEKIGIIQTAILI